MPGKKKIQNSTDFPNKWWNKLPAGFVDTAEGKSNDELKGIILKSEGIISDIEKDMDDDKKLQTLKEDLKDLRGGYMDTINAETAKTKYCLHLLRLRGDR
jgi:hypothetical protein